MLLIFIFPKVRILLCAKKAILPLLSRLKRKLTSIKAMMYQMNAQYMRAVQPLRQLCSYTRLMTTSRFNPLSGTYFYRTFNAALELMERMTTNYEEPEWDLGSATIFNRNVQVDYRVAMQKPHCNLLHFKRRMRTADHPKVLMVAPLSGHFATLLRGTVKAFLPDHDVYITDWRNVREVPVSDGEFHFDDYVDYLIDFMAYLGPDTHLLAVCQPCVPTLVALAVMAQNNSNNMPKSMTLMGGPVDARVSPTEVNDYASDKDIEWFEKNVICRVPKGFKGEGQLVYPGFIQLSGFMSMNMDNHVSKHFKFFGDLIRGDGDSAEAHRKFYNEYLAVMDLPANYYLDTIRNVFLDYKLPQGLLKYRGSLVDLKAIKNTALLTVEGELDDITGKGQTSVALSLCANIPSSKKEHYEQRGVGHYGIFNGRKFRDNIAPLVKEFMLKHS